MIKLILICVVAIYARLKSSKSTSTHEQDLIGVWSLVNAVSFSDKRMDELFSWPSNLVLQLEKNKVARVYTHCNDFYSKYSLLPGLIYFSHLTSTQKNTGSCIHLDTIIKHLFQGIHEIGVANNVLLVRKIDGRKFFFRRIPDFNESTEDITATVEAFSSDQASSSLFETNNEIDSEIDVDPDIQA